MVPEVVRSTVNTIHLYITGISRLGLTNCVILSAFTKQVQSQLQY